MTELLTLASLEQKFGVQILGRSQRTQRCQRLTTAAPFIGKKLCCTTTEMGTANSLHAQNGEYNEKLISFIHSRILFVQQLNSTNTWNTQ